MNSDTVDTTFQLLGESRYDLNSRKYEYRALDAAIKVIKRF